LAGACILPKTSSRPWPRPRRRALSPLVVKPRSSSQLSPLLLPFTEQNSVEGEEVGGLNNGVASLGRSVHLAQDFLVEGLPVSYPHYCCPSHVTLLTFECLGSPRPSTRKSWAGLGQGLDVAVHGVLIGQLVRSERNALPLEDVRRPAGGQAEIFQSVIPIIVALHTSLY
jgi:hypothetical protein